MAEEPPVVRLADSISAVLYGIVSWIAILIGVFFVLVGLNWPVQGGLTLGTLVMLVFLVSVGAIIIATGAFTNPRLRRQLNRYHSPTTVGTTHTVDERVIHSAESPGEPCVSCGGRVSRGLHRRFREEYVLFGLPVHTASVGHNYYCLPCAIAELGLEDTRTPDRNGVVGRGEAVGSDRIVSDGEGGTDGTVDESVLRE